MEQFSKVLRIRRLPVETVSQAKKVVEMAINEYNIVPFVPINQKLRFHNRFEKSPRKIFKKSKDINFISFWTENMKCLSREYYFGKKRKLKDRIVIANKRIQLLPKYSEPIFKGDLRMIALDMKSEMISKILISDYEMESPHFVLIDILVIRPLTFSEYISLFIRYPETSLFVDAALGFSYESLFNKIFEENTGVSFPIMIAPYLADVFTGQL